MKRTLLFLVLSASILSGCVSITTSTVGEREMIVIENNGWKFLNCMPIASGDPDYPNQEVSIWFRDSVTLNNNMWMLNEEIKKRGARGFKDLCSYKTEEQTFLFLFKRYTLHTSAELTR